jgi:hypothetical protein
MKEEEKLQLYYDFCSIMNNSFSVSRNSYRKIMKLFYEEDIVMNSFIFYNKNKTPPLVAKFSNILHNLHDHL